MTVENWITESVKLNESFFEAVLLNKLVKPVHESDWSGTSKQ